MNELVKCIHFTRDSKIALLKICTLLTQPQFHSFAYIYTDFSFSSFHGIEQQSLKFLALRKNEERKNILIRQKKKRNSKVKQSQPLLTISPSEWLLPASTHYSFPSLGPWMTEKHHH